MEKSVPKGNPEPPDSNDGLGKYEQQLLELKHEAIREWDKWVMTLSGGALGVSFAFVKDLVQPENMIRIDLLFYAWVAWGSSILLVLASFYCGYQAMEKAIDQVRAGRIHDEPPGGKWDWIIRNIMNPGSGIFFLLGVLLISIFARVNLGHISETKDAPGATINTTNRGNTAYARPTATRTTTTTTTTTETGTTTEAR